VRTLREQLQLSLPSVLLLLGPEHTGKKTFAWELALLHAPIGEDRLWISHLNIPAVARVHTFAYLAPVRAPKVAVIVLTMASSAALNRLLKLLEEPPETVRFVLVARKEPLDTIRSRAEVLTFGVGSDPRLSERESASKTAALNAIRAAQAQDSSLLRTALRNWGAEDSKMLAQWCEERVSGRWRHYVVTDVSADEGFAQRLLAGLTANRAARPRLAARTALEAASRTEK
jgi:hypothetical protein